MNEKLSPGAKDEQARLNKIAAEAKKAAEKQVGQAAAITNEMESFSKSIKDVTKNLEVAIDSVAGKSKKVIQEFSEDVKSLPDSIDASDEIQSKFSNFLNIKGSINKLTAEDLFDASSIKKYTEDTVKSLAEAQEARAKKLKSNLMTIATADSPEIQESQVKGVQTDQMAEVAEGAARVASLVNSMKAEATFAQSKVPGSTITQAGQLLADGRANKAREATLKKIIDDEAKYKAAQELKFIRENNGILTAEAASRIELEAGKRKEAALKNLDALTEAELKADAERAEQKAAEDKIKAIEDAGKAINDNLQTLASKDASWRDKKAAFKDLTTTDGEFDGTKALYSTLTALSDYAKQLETKIDDIASYQSTVDTRLQGSSNGKYFDSYWRQFIRDITYVGSVTPYFKQEDYASNIRDLVSTGIAFNVDERAFLMTIKDKIATTFEVADGTLLRLIRIQQEDSTAGRLGMEATLNHFLNNMYENTEYLKQVASSVRGNLEEMQSLMPGKEATEVEYQVQKWLGSAYSVGMSQTAVNSISASLGQIGAGQIEGITQGGTGNLLIMAANDAGLPITDLLANGLTADETNELLNSAVKYLADLAESSKDNQVVQQQLASVFGVKASDLKAASNLVNSSSSVYGNTKSYDELLGKLFTLADSMGSRTSLAEKMSNIWSNGQYSLAGSIAENPILYLIYKTATVLDDTVGGMPVPFVDVMGTGVDLETSVADIMRVTALGGGILSSLGPMLSGLSSSFSGRAMLNKLGIKSETALTVTPRGTEDTSSGPTGGGTSGISASGHAANYIGNASSSDIKENTLASAKDEKKQLMIEAKEGESPNQLDSINGTVLKIYELLDEVAHGNKTLSVKVEEYGLTRTASASGSSIGGVSAAGALSTGTGTAGSTSVNGILSDFRNQNSLNLGGWTANL